MGKKIKSTLSIRKKLHDCILSVTKYDIKNQFPVNPQCEFFPTFIYFQPQI